MLHSCLLSCRRGLLLAVMLLTTLALSAKTFTVVIDPGHGGKDPGAVAYGGQEKTINLQVSLKLGALIKEKYPDVKVVYTRTTDKYVTLKERPEIANRAGADLFICIHTNAAESGSAYGAETFARGIDKNNANLEVVKRENSVMMLEDNYQETYKGFDPRSTDSYIMFELMQDTYSKNNLKLAECVQNELVKAGRHNRGVRQAGFWVLHQTMMPSILVELGFITNANEARFMLTASGQQAMANALFKGFENYKKFYDNTSGKAKQTTDDNKTEVKEENKSNTNAKNDDNNKENATNKTSTTSKGNGKEKNQQTTVKKEDKKEQNTTTTTTNDGNKNKNEASKVGDIVFKVQILAADKMIAVGDAQFKGLKNVEVYKENGFYKFTYGKTSNYAEIVEIRKNILSKFPEAFIVAFDKDKKITVQEARTALQNKK